MFQLDIVIRVDSIVIYCPLAPFAYSGCVGVSRPLYFPAQHGDQNKSSCDIIMTASLSPTGVQPESFPGGDRVMVIKDNVCMSCLLSGASYWVYSDKE